MRFALTAMMWLSGCAVCVSQEVAAPFGSEGVTPVVAKSAKETSAAETSAAAGQTDAVGPKAMVGQTEPRSYRVRLPAYYGKLALTEQQRTDVYAVQRRFGMQLEELTRRIADLKMDRQRELNEILDARQREQLMTMKSARTRPVRIRPASTRLTEAEQAERLTGSVKTGQGRDGSGQPGRIEPGSTEAGHIEEATRRDSTSGS